MSTIARLAYRGRDLLFTAAANRAWRKRVGGTVRCLLYHRIGHAGDCEFLDRFGAECTRPDDLRADLDFLKGQGARFLTFADLRAGTFPLRGEFGVVVSFDDGTRDVYEQGLPILEAVGARGVVFQISGLVGARALIWEHRLYWLWQEPTRRVQLLDALRAETQFDWVRDDDATLDRLRLSPEVGALRRVLDELPLHPDNLQALCARLSPDAAQLREAVARGHEIGSHGRHHLPRQGMSEQQFEQELVQSKAELAAHAGVEPQSFSHPYNMWQPADRPLLARHYRSVATVVPAPIRPDSDPLALPRFNWPGRFRNRLRWRRWLWTGE